MPQFKLGLTQKDKEEIKAKEQKERLSRVQSHESARNRKLADLTRKSKQNKLIVIVSFLVLSTALLVFGIYNTFIKSVGLSEDEVQRMIKVNDVQKYNEGGLSGFLYNNIDSLFARYLEINGGDKGEVEKYTVDKNSFRIVRQDTSTSAIIVFFEVDINVKLKDTETTNDKGEKIVTPGDESVATYYFSVFVNAKNEKGYFSFGSDLILQNVVRQDITDIITSDWLVFSEETICDENTTQNARIKLDRILSDIYEGKDVGDDLSVDIDLDTREMQYLGITSFKLYTQNNKFGYNAVVQYKLLTKEDIIFTTTTYLRLENVSGSWRISRFF